MERERERERERVRPDSFILFLRDTLNKCAMALCKNLDKSKKFIFISMY